MESLVPALWDWGVPESHVHFEAFGPASVKRVERRRHAAAIAPCDVRFERSDRTADVGRIVRVALGIRRGGGVAMPSGCRAGSCGECLMAIRSGNVTHGQATGHPGARRAIA